MLESGKIQSTNCNSNSRAFSTVEKENLSFDLFTTHNEWLGWGEGKLQLQEKGAWADSICALLNLKCLDEQEF